MRGAPRVCALLACLLCFNSAAIAGNGGARVLVVLANHLSLADVVGSATPNLADMERDGALALMSPGLPRGADPEESVYASLGAGDSIALGDPSQGLLGRTLRERGIQT